MKELEVISFFLILEIPTSQNQPGLRRLSYVVYFLCYWWSNLRSWQCYWRGRSCAECLLLSHHRSGRSKHLLETVNWVEAV